jgi:hypothetical protein
LCIAVIVAVGVFSIGRITYDGGAVAPGEPANVRYTVSETYLGDPVRIPVTVVNGDREGPTLFLSAAAHGDELNGIEIVREVAHEWDHADLRGTLICMPVLNVPGFIAQERYLPIYDRDLNRSFPGSETVTSADRIAGLSSATSSNPATSGSTSTPPPAAGRTCSTSGPTRRPTAASGWRRPSPRTSSSRATGHGGRSDGPRPTTARRS